MRPNRAEQKKMRVEFVAQTPELGKKTQADMGNVLERIRQMKERLNKLTSTEKELFRQQKVAAALVNHYAKNLELAHERAEVAEKKAREALVDEVTGLLQKQGFTEAITSIQRKSDQMGTLLILDGDGFKKINDTYGHLTGNAVLKKIGEYLVKNTRETDIAARWGGDEFVIFFPNARSEEIMKKFRFEGETEPGKESGMIIPLELEITEKGQPTIKKINMHMSGGLTSFSIEEERLDEAFKRADKAMYEAKKAGRGHFRVYQE